MKSTVTMLIHYRRQNLYMLYSYDPLIWSAGHTLRHSNVAPGTALNHRHIRQDTCSRQSKVSKNLDTSIESRGT